jgi:hypothetical protein
MSARQSRFSMLVEGNIDAASRLSAYGEFDLQGAGEMHSQSSSQCPPVDKRAILPVGCWLRLNKTELADQRHYQSNGEGGSDDYRAQFVHRPRRGRDRD